MNPNSNRPTAFGSTGFIVLDIVEPNRDVAPVRLHLGGSAGNVTGILGSLGWDAWPVARMPRGEAGFSQVVAELTRFDVHTDFAFADPTDTAAKLPLLVQRKRKFGCPTEPSFTSRCPRCGSRLLNWSPVTNKSAQSMLEQLPAFKWFYTDRFQASCVTLARHAKGLGAQVFFDPTSLNRKEPADVKRFKTLLELADVVKYSAQRFAHLDDVDFPRSPALEIQTRGSAGLVYRRHGSDDCTSLAAPSVNNIVDTCGAGDWLTAILIHLIGTDFVAELTDEELREKLFAAQQAGAWACGFPGARGGMYWGTADLSALFAWWTGSIQPLDLACTSDPPLSRDTTLKEVMREFCPTCRGDWLKDVTMQPTGEYGAWRSKGRPGYVGKLAAQRRADLNRTYGPGNWRITYGWNGGTIPRGEALELYTNAYEQHLANAPDVLDWLVRSARDVYDISPSDVESGHDFRIQKQRAHHLQDIAIRIAVHRLGRRFEGAELIQVRKKKSPGHSLNPGIVPFHDPDAIEQPELTGWWRPGSIESFWQNNKILEVRLWASRIFVFGGSFNPLHNAHLQLARLARDEWGFDKVLFVPNGDNYRKKTLAHTPAKVRLEMVQAAVADEPGMETTDAEVLDSTPVRTPVTMRELAQRYPNAQLALFRGMDSLHRTHRDCFQLPNLLSPG